MSNKSDRENLELYAPESYWAATPDELGKIVNGCGTSGWKGKLVPETLYDCRYRKAAISMIGCTIMAKILTTKMQQIEFF